MVMASHTRDFISVDDVADSILLSLRATKNNYGNGLKTPLIFNIGTGTATSITVLALKMISISGLDLSPLYQEASGFGSNFAQLCRHEEGEKTSSVCS